MSHTSAQTMETLSKSMSISFLIVLSVLSGFHFSSKFGRHSFSVNLFISKVFFPSKSYIFACNSHQQYTFMHKCNSMLKYPLFDNQSKCRFTFSYVILLNNLLQNLSKANQLSIGRGGGGRVLN